jgi:hypothetical protein
VHASRSIGFGDSFQSAASRRGVVVGVYASYAALLACFGLLLAPNLRAGEVSAVALAALAGAAVGLLVMVLVWTANLVNLGRSIADDDQHALDERQLMLRNAAYYRAYRVAMVPLAVLLPYIGVAGELGLPHPNTVGQWTALGVTLFFAVSTLPSALLVWRHPVPGYADDDERSRPTYRKFAADSW